MAGESIAMAIYRLGLESQQYVASAQIVLKTNQDLAASMGKTTQEEEKQNKAFRGGSDYFAKREQALSAAARAEAAYAKEVANAAKARAAGIGDDLQAANVISLADEKRRRAIAGIELQDAAMRKSATTTGLARYELINLSRQFQDIGVSLAGGQSPFRILIEQGSQIADVFASSKAAFGDTFRSLIGWVGRFAGSAAGIVTALAAVGAAGAAAALSWREGQREIERSLIGIGEASGLSVAKVNEIAATASSTTRLSTSGAREAAMEFIKTGKIYEENVARATQLTDKFALAIGKDTTTAAKELAEILSDTGKGADTLGKMFGNLDGKTREYLSSLVRANKEQEAQKFLMDLFEPTIKKAAEATSVWTRAWMGFTKALSDSYDMMGKAITRAGELETPPRTPGERTRQGSPGRVMAQGMRAADDEALAFGQSQQALAAAADAAAKALEAENKRIAEWTRQADDAVTAIIPQIRQIQSLEGALKDLERAQEDARVSGKMGFADQLQPAIDATKLQIQLQKESQAETARHVTAVTELAAKYQDVSIAVAMTLESLKDQTAVAQATPGPEKAAAEDQARFNQLRLEGKTIGEAENVVLAERALKIAQANAAIQAQITAQRQGVQLDAARLNGTTAIVAATHAEENAIRSGASAQAAKIAAMATYLVALNKANVQEEFAVRNQEVALQAIQARTSSERIAVASAQAYNQALEQGKFLWQAQADAARAVTLEIERQAQTHRDNMQALEDQLRVARARSEAERLSAQYEADINSRIREGATEMQASEEAAMKRKIGEENEAKKHSNDLGKILEEEEKRLAAIRKQNEELEKQFLLLGKNLRESNKLAGSAHELAAKLATIGTGIAKVTRDIGNVNFADIQQQGTQGGPLVGAAGMSVALNVDLVGLLGRGLISAINNIPAMQMQTSIQTIIDAMDPAKAAAANQAALDKAAATQQAAAQAAQDAAQAAQQAAEAQRAAAQAAIEAAEAMRKATISSLDEQASQNIAYQLIYGTATVRQINAAIEAGQIQFGTAQQRFETQLDLYKRAGMSNAQIAADIRAGLIGENVAPTELLSALDSLTESVDANTAAQIGLSDFYTQQGDRLVGYRGLNVQTGIRSPIGATAPGTGTEAGGMGGMPGAVATPPAQVAYEVTHPPIPGSSTAQQNNYYYYYPPPGTAPAAPTQPTNTYQQQQVALLYNQPSSTNLLSGLYGPTRTFQHGGIADRPTMGIFGEAGPEAFVPLKGGAIPVKLTGNAANENRPTNIFNAPLIYFASEPTSNEVRQTVFQAAQMLRRVAS